MERENKIFKVWGIRDRVHLSEKCEIDLIYLKPNSFCSTHYHKNKINKFVVIQGELIIKTSMGEINLKEGERIVIEPPLIHQFRTNDKCAIVLELAYVDKGRVSSADIVRLKQGGRRIDNQDIILDNLKGDTL
jgi:mannose-6-phosphate isomerase-like protein (cupin superfamily)